MRCSTASQRVCAKPSRGTWRRPHSVVRWPQWHRADERFVRAGKGATQMSRTRRYAPRAMVMPKREVLWGEGAKVAYEASCADEKTALTLERRRAPMLLSVRKTTSKQHNLVQKRWIMQTLLGHCLRKTLVFKPYCKRRTFNLWHKYPTSVYICRSMISDRLAGWGLFTQQESWMATGL